MKIYSEKQIEVFKNAHARWNILSGAVRAGKTHVSYDLLLQKLRTLPDGPVLLVGRTERTLQRNILDPMRAKFHSISSIKNPGVVDIFGRKCYCVGASDERAVQKIQGLGLILAYCDEITTYPMSFWEMLKSRLDKPESTFIGTCNPESPSHYIKEFLDRPDLDIYQKHFVIDDNPFLCKEFVENLKKEYTGFWARRYLQGEWCISEGAVYSIFDPAMHIINELPEQGTRNYYLGIDYGTTNPTAALLLGDYNDKLIVIDEYYYDSKKTSKPLSDSEHAINIKNFVTGRYPQRIFIDPSAASLKIALQQKNLTQISPADNDVISGIRTVANLFTNKQLFILKDKAPNLIRELYSYSWDTDYCEKTGTDRPISRDNHACDALRYIINTHFKRGLQKFTRMSMPMSGVNRGYNINREW